MNPEYVVLGARMEQAQQTNDDGYLDGVALNLHSFYTGVEHIFEDIARVVDTSLPDSPSWHQDLLLQMASPVNGLRPAVISQKTRRCLDEYRGFRHIVRNVYTFNLRASRLAELTAELPSCYDMLVKELLAFAHLLQNPTNRSDQA